MQIELKQIKIKDLVANYQDNQEKGVIGYRGKLDIRPPYQREFVYKNKQRDAVIHTIKNKFPLNVMYWAVKEDGNFEIIDGQQRTISICQYINKVFSFEDLYFHNLPIDIQEDFLNFEIMVYFCNGTDSEKLEWFKTINIAGEKLTPQELRNAVYSGSWVTDAKKYFSKNGCQANNIGGKYFKGSSIRQEYLETVIKWINNGKIENYMSKNQHKENAEELWIYFQEVIDWLESLFKNYRKEMKGIEWGDLYNQFKDKQYNLETIEQEVKKLMENEDIQKKSGIYYYIFDRKQKHLNLRAFNEKIKREIYETQNGTCPLCEGENTNKQWKIEEMEADHIIPWCEGGKTNKDNCQMLCKACNRQKSAQ